MKTQAFAALMPMSAIADRELTGVHLRVLAAIASHDRNSLRRGKGQGCTASHQTLARETGGVHTNNIGTAITDLVKRGYVHAERRGRLHVYRVNYEHQTTSGDVVRNEGTTPTDVVQAASQAAAQAEAKATTSSGVPQAPRTTSKSLEKAANHLNEKEKLDGINYAKLRVINKKDEKELGNGIDCAEARGRSAPVSEAETYLGECEALAASSDCHLLRYERVRITQLADDPCQPEQVNERAAKLLSALP